MNPRPRKNDRERVYWNQANDILREGPGMDISKLSGEPIFFEPNRVYRVYSGGKGFEGLLDDAVDGEFPEEWVASRVRAINPKSFGERDGVSRVEGTGLFFDDLLDRYPDELLGDRKYDCLVKFLDSAIRLPVQVHPTKEFSRKHFRSEYGKTEAWLVIATRENPKLYLGFNRKIDKSTLSELESRSATDRDAMRSILNEVTPKVGDAYLIPAGLIHAIGPGCTLLEIQEPTDFTIQPERMCGDCAITEAEEFIGLGKSVALDCFDYDLCGERALRLARKTPRILSDANGILKESIISHSDTPCFAENRWALTDATLRLETPVSVWIALEGEGTLSTGRTISRGDYFFLPRNATDISISAHRLVLIECLPSAQGA